MSDAVDVPSVNWAVQITASVTTTPPRINLNWVGDNDAIAYHLCRKLPQEGVWHDIANLDGKITTYADTNVVIGIGYEYRVIKDTNILPFYFSTVGYNAYGHIYAGIELPLNESRGSVILMVESSVAQPLQGELLRLEYDLRGDGWNVVQGTADATEPVTSVKGKIANLYAQTGARALFLIGHIPVPYSGDISPDEHPNHTGAWPADVYYGDLDGVWTDQTVNDTQAEREENHNVPGDGKFDQGQIPSSVELEVGRVDLWNMTCYLNKMPALTEVDLLRRYLDKDHNFRTGINRVQMRALICDDLGSRYPEALGAQAWRVFPTFVGSAIDALPNTSYFPSVSSGSYLWSAVFAGGSYYIASDTGSADDFGLNNVNVAFASFVGSYYGDWDNESNFLRASLGSPGTLVATFYGGKPQWFIHHMALGETIGYSTRVTQDNGPDGPYLPHNPGSGQVHISLLGDPTLRAHPLSSVSNVRGVYSVDGLTLSWDPVSVPGLNGYNVYQAPAREGPYQNITPQPLTTTSMMIPNAGAADFFMVKPLALTQSPSGTYYNSGTGSYYPNPLNATPKIEGFPQKIDAVPGQPVSITLSASSSPGTAFTFTLLTQPAKGTLAGSPPALVYTPNSNASGRDSFLFSVSDGTTVSEPIAISIQVAGENHPPVASSLSLRALAGSPSPVTLIGSDVDGDNLTYQVTDPPTKGQLSGNGANLTYTPAESSSGTDTFAYIVNDGIANSAPATVTIIVVPLNHPPLADNVSAQTPENTPVTITLSATDPDGDFLTFQVLTAPQFGKLSGIPPNLTYTPENNFSGSDTFTYVAWDAQSQSAIATVSLTITPQKGFPVVSDLKAEGVEDQPVAITLVATGVANDPVDFLVLQNPGHGKLSGGPPSLTYTPDQNFSGSDSFTYAAVDGPNQSASAKVLISIGRQNHLPQVANLSLSAAQGETIPVSLSGTDIDGDPLTFKLLTNPTKGSLSGTPPNLQYTPASNSTGTETFSYSASDGQAESAPATVSIQIVSRNHAPIASNQTLFLGEDQPFQLTLAASDPDGDPLTFQIVSPPSIGSLTGTPPHLTYVPNPDANGTDSFQYRVSDGVLESPLGTISLIIAPQIDPPKITPIADLVVDKDATLAPIEIKVVDVDSNAVTLTASSSNPALIPNSSLLIVGTQLFIGPIAGQTGSAIITVRATDINRFSEAIFTITIRETPPPTLNFKLELAKVIGKSGISITITGPANSPFQIQTSVDAKHWSLLTESRFDSAGQTQLADDISGKQMCFYRVLLP